MPLPIDRDDLTTQLPNNTEITPDLISRFVKSLQKAVEKLAQTRPDRIPDDPVCEEQTLLFKETFAVAQESESPVMAGLIRYRLGSWYVSRRRFQHGLYQFDLGIQTLRTQSSVSPFDSLGTKVSLQDQDSTRKLEKNFAFGDSPPVAADTYKLGILLPEELLLRKTATNELLRVLCVNGANLYLLQEQWAIAETLYREALELELPFDDLITRQQILSNLVWCSLKEGKTDLALEQLEQLKKLDPEARFRISLAPTLLAEGTALIRKEKYHEAVPVLEESLKLNLTAKKPRGEWKTLTQLGIIDLRLNRLEDGKSKFLKAEQLIKQTQNGQNLDWQVPVGLAQIFRAAGELTRALDYYLDYLKIIDQIQQSFSTDQGKFSVLETHRIYLDEIVSLIFEINPDDPEQIVKILELARRRSLPSLMTARKDRPQFPMGTISIKEFSEHFGNWEIYFSQFGPGTNSKAQNTIHSKSMTGDAWNEDLTPDNQETLPVQKIFFLQYYVLPKQVVIFVQKPSGEQIVRTSKISQTQLEEDIINCRLNMGVFEPGEISIARGFAPSNSISPPITASVGPPIESQATEQETCHKLLGKLYETLIAPVIHELPTDKKTVCIIPHDCLWLLPFPALHDDLGKYLIDLFPFTWAVSIQHWNKLARRERSRDHTQPSFCVVGNPGSQDGDQRWEPLFWAEDEARSIAGMIDENQVDLYLGASADPLLISAWHKKYSVLHFATHGWVHPQKPLGSFIQLAPIQEDSWKIQQEPDNIFNSDGVFLSDFNKKDANIGELFRASSEQPKFGLKNVTEGKDGKTVITHKDHPDKPVTITKYLDHEKLLRLTSTLTAKEIMDYFDLNADLVVLSACRSGLGKQSSEGMIGMTRAFLAAGARSLMVSLWNVDDRATFILMEHFYKEYLSHGNKALALQGAIQKMKATHSNPKFWAAFTMVGMDN